MNEQESNNIRVKLNEIAFSLSNITEYNNNSNNLLGDNSGVALFMFYMHKLTGREAYYNTAVSLMEDVIRIHESFDVIPSAISKFGWLLNHLNKFHSIEANVLEYFENIDHYLFEFMLNSLKKDNYDFLHGSLSVVLFFLSRENITITHSHYLSTFIDELFKKSSQNNNDELKWLSIIDFKTNEKLYNISMSHGISSIIAVLSKLHNRGIEKEKTKHLIEGAVSYLLQQKLPANQYNSIYPNLALESMDKLYSSRLAWCYGDLGIAVALWHASQALNNKAWEKEAIDSLLHSAKRRDLLLNGAVDAGLCHGTAGIAHIFNRMYGYTKLEELKDA